MEKNQTENITVGYPNQSEMMKKYSQAKEEEKLQESKIYEDIKSELLSHSSE